MFGSTEGRKSFASEEPKYRRPLDCVCRNVWAMSRMTFRASLVGCIFGLTFLSFSACKDEKFDVCEEKTGEQPVQFIACMLCKLLIESNPQLLIPADQ